jgi:phosphatidylserine/phosphatidylglycerophosphate/cardiolipin synthase-like enzyme
VSEGEIPDAVMEMLGQVEEGDEVRIQMFYLSYVPVAEAVVEASQRTKKPVRILLDANKDSFNKEKDGTPNRQVARYLKKMSENIEVRWYSTHGEQNHAKIMTITNAKRGKYELTTGSCNWTGRNMDGVNMEANVLVSDSKKLCGSFNDLFDMFWSNGDGNEYSVDYEAFSETASGWKWKRGEKPFYWSTF